MDNLHRRVVNPPYRIFSSTSAWSSQLYNHSYSYPPVSVKRRPGIEPGKSPTMFNGKPHGDWTRIKTLHRNASPPTWRKRQVYRRKHHTRYSLLITVSGYSLYLYQPGLLISITHPNFIIIYELSVVNHRITNAFRSAKPHLPRHLSKNFTDPDLFCQPVAL